MHTSTSNAIAALLRADPEVTEEVFRHVTDACKRGPRPGRKGTAAEAGEVLGVCGRTVERYARDGKLRAIRYSARRVRYDLDEVQRLAERGVE